jgi:hypothetical protein
MVNKWDKKGTKAETKRIQNERKGEKNRIRVLYNNERKTKCVI